MKRFFHYTLESRLQTIIDSGEINLATKSTYLKKEKPVAWVSTNAIWENTATKMKAINGKPVMMSFDEQVKEFGCARIEVKDIGLMTWAKLKYKAKMDFNIADRMEAVGISKGSRPSEWHGSLTTIKKKNWIRAEVFKDGEWVLYEEFKD
ncbi:hypothetical protein VO54_02203 [Elizabethkingia miricola]|nr:hypothetical protein VO54_02203 [Elizabethkingia miricola]